MDKPSADLLVQILRDCSRRTPDPLYPAEYAEQAGLERQLLDRGLDRLRLGGWLRLTDWVAGKGQGYAITSEGEQALRQPNLHTLLQIADHFTDAAAMPGRPRLQVAADGLAPTTWDRGEAVRAAVMNIPPPIATMTLIALNVLMFLVGAVLASVRGISLEHYLSFNSNDPAVAQLRSDLGSLDLLKVVTQGQWWRLFSYWFVHGGLVHLILNMYFLYSLGPLLESMWGRRCYLYLYAVSGFSGGVAVVFRNESAVGASGALCGLLTSMVWWIWLNRSHLGPEVTQRWLRGVLFNILLMAIISSLPAISAASHFGGGLAGLLIAYPMTFYLFGNRRQHAVGLAGMLAVPLAAAAAFWAVDGDNDTRRIRAITQHFLTAELKIEHFRNEHKSLFTATPHLPEPNKIADVRKACQQTHLVIKNALREIRSVTSLRQPEWNKEIKLIPEYLEASDTLFAELARDLDTPENWPQRSEALVGSYRKWQEAQKALTASKPLEELTGLTWRTLPDE